MEIKCAFSERVNLNDLKQHPLNKNKHPQKQIKRLAKLFEYHGIRHPIIVSKRSGYIVAGHGRLEAARACGLSEFPVDYQDFDSDESEYAFLQADNAIAPWAELDVESIKVDVKSFKDSFDVDWLGIDDFKLFENESNQNESNKIDTKLIQCPHCGESFEKKKKNEL